MVQALSDLDIDFHPEFFSKIQADFFYTALLQEIPWEQHFVKMFGKKIAAPRRSSWHGAADAHYRYSGVTYPPKPYTLTLQKLLDALQAEGLQFNSVLCNHYRSGLDSMGWHSDDEPELGQNPVIASLSFGSTRRFCFRHKQLALKHELALTHGSLLIMQGATQHSWQHALPKTTKPAEADLFSAAEFEQGRVNLTFRWVKVADQNDE